MNIAYIALAFLQVVDDAQKFDGIFDRSKLTASILTEIANRVDKAK